MKLPSRSGHRLGKVIKFLSKVGLDLVITLARSKKQCQACHRSDDWLSKNLNMTSSLTHESKKPNSKTLKFSGEEKKQQDNHFMLGPRMQKVLDTVRALIAAVVGCQKEICANASDERKWKSNEVQISAAMTNHIQLSPRC